MGREFLTVDLGRIARDILSDDRDLALLALTSVTQLSKTALAERSSVLRLLESLELVARGSDSELVFLARKGLNHVQRVSLVRLNHEQERILPDNRSELLSFIETEQEPRPLARALSKLINIGCASDVSVVKEFLKNTDPRVRSNAAEFIGKHGDDSTIISSLAPLLGDENNRVKGTVASVLGLLGYPRVIEYLEELLRSPDVSVRESAAYAAAGLKGPQVQELLLKALKDPFEGVRLRVVEGLGRLKDPAVLPLLRPMLRDPSIDVCEAAERAMSFISFEQAQGFVTGDMSLSETSSLENIVPLGDDTEDSSCPDSVWVELGHRVFVVQQEHPMDHDSVTRAFYQYLETSQQLERHRSRMNRMDSGEVGPTTDVGNPIVGDVVESERSALQALELEVSRRADRLGRLVADLVVDGQVSLNDSVLEADLVAAHSMERSSEVGGD